MDYIEIYKEEHIQNKLSYSEIRKKYNISRGTWDYYIREKANLNSDKRTYRAKDSFFDEINTEEKAYLLGFFYADGYLTNDKRMGIRLQYTDEEIIKLFQKYICPENPIEHGNNQNFKRKPQVSIRWRSKNMYEKLQSLGFAIDKTHVQSNIFKFIPENLKRHFLRGFTDGDGCIQVKNLENGHNRKISIAWSNGTSQILKDIVEWLPKFSWKLYNKNTYFVLRIDVRKSVYEIIKLLYTDCNIYLSRKKCLADKIIEFCNKNTELT